MNPQLLSFLRLCCINALCLLMAGTVQAFEYEIDDASTPQVPAWQDDKPAWQEQGVDLPLYPASLDSLIRLNISTSGLPYQIYLDPDSLSTGEDRVVRFTTVLVSSTGVWNVTYEGLHCGAKNFRRFAYGMNDNWRLLRDSSWQPVTGRGAGQYRKFLYDNYMCDPSERYLKADELVRRLRY
jgi:hypothetical protein